MVLIGKYPVMPFISEGYGFSEFFGTGLAVRIVTGFL